MLNFSHQVKTKFVFGKGAESQVGKELQKLGVQRVLLHRSDGIHLRDLIRNIKENLEAHDIFCCELGGVKPNPRLEVVREGIKLVRDKDIDFILAVGGGSVIDSAKAIAAGAVYEDDVWDLFTNESSVQGALKTGVVLSYPAAGSESSNVTVINNTDTNQKLLVRSEYLTPAVVFMNPELTYTLPKRLVAAGIVDIFSHICERYFAPETYIGIIDRMEEAALKTLVSIGAKALDNPEEYQYRSELMWLATIAQNDTLGVGRVHDWGTHVIANELSALYDKTHGETLSVIMIPWMRYVYKNDIHRFARYAREVFDVTSKQDIEAQALEGIRKTEEFFRELNTPISINELDIPILDVQKLAGQVQYDKQSGTIGKFAVLDKRDVVNILNDTAKC
ncbi:iron-containing alcohol dehydrogenase [Oceanobacillus sp. FSL W8-0428]|uniref:iron-containing alcohol dehydrogenase n=1 Tax=Oceanobacillus sp. FSL W8-0428 TaxID=2921715 RepID=UPI0030FCFDBC